MKKTITMFVTMFSVASMGAELKLNHGESIDLTLTDVSEVQTISCETSSLPLCTLRTMFIGEPSYSVRLGENSNGHFGDINDAVERIELLRKAKLCK